jgi:hypothetical protein
MCTVTIVPLRLADGPAGFRLASNRDELRSRPPARPPAVYPVGEGWAGMPIDPQGGGTWIGINDRGLAMTLLNAGDREGGPPPSSARSRGLVIPALLASTSIAETRRAVRALDAEAYRPFRLVVTDGTDAFEAWWNRESFVVSDRGSPRLQPLFFTSSSLGDALVDGPRRLLFEERLGDVGPDHDPAIVIERQDAFHRHQWPDRPQLSVSMSRADARTVSVTIVDVGRSLAVMTYHPDAPAAGPSSSAISLPLRARPGA